MPQCLLIMKLQKTFKHNDVNCNHDDDDFEEDDEDDVVDDTDNILTQCYLLLNVISFWCYP